MRGRGSLMPQDLSRRGLLRRRPRLAARGLTEDGLVLRYKVDSTGTGFAGK